MKTIAAILATLIVVAIIIIFTLGQGRYAGGPEFEKQQPALVTSEGVFTCQFDFDGATIFSDYKCKSYMKTLELSPGMTPTVILPTGTKEIVIDTE